VALRDSLYSGRRPAGRHGFGGAVIGSNAYFVGGSLTPGGGGITDQLIMFSLP
jgi:hypothetical protein